MTLTFDPVMGIAVARDNRIDWQMSKAVDKAIEMLSLRTDHEKVHDFLKEEMVPPYVIRKVLAGHAVRR